MVWREVVLSLTSSFEFEVLPKVFQILLSSQTEIDRDGSLVGRPVSTDLQLGRIIITFVI